MSTAASSSAGPSRPTPSTKLNPRSAVFFAPPEQQNQQLQSPFPPYDRPLHHANLSPLGRAQPPAHFPGQIAPPPPGPNGYYGAYQQEPMMHYNNHNQHYGAMAGGGQPYGKLHGGWQAHNEPPFFVNNFLNPNQPHHIHHNNRPLPHQGVYFPIQNGPPVPTLMSPPPPPPVNLSQAAHAATSTTSSSTPSTALRPPSASPTVTPTTIGTSPSPRLASSGPPLVPTPELKQTTKNSTTISFTPGELQAPPTPPTFAPPPASSSGRRTKPPPPRDAAPLSFGPNVKPPAGIIVKRPVPVPVTVPASPVVSLKSNKIDTPAEVESSATTPTASGPPSIAQAPIESSSPKSVASGSNQPALAIPALSIKELTSISTTATVASSIQSSPILGPASPTTTTTTVDESLLPSTPKSAASAVTSPGPTPAAAPAKKSWADLVRSPTSGKPHLNANGLAATPITEHIPKTVALQPSSSGPGGKKSLAQALEGVEVDFRLPAISPRGLVNNGNLCFANAILQVLVYCAPFWNLMAAIRRETSLDLSGTTPSMDAMIVFLEEFRANNKVSVVRHRSKSSISSAPLASSSDPTPADAQASAAEFAAASNDPFVPEQVYESLKPNSRFDAMTRGTQEDAEEFLGFFLDTLHEEILATIDRVDKGKRVESAEAEGEADDWLEVGSKGRTATTRTTETRESPITKIFGGQLRSVLKCPGQRDSVTLEPYQRLQLDIEPEHVRTIEDALANLTMPEPLPDYITSRGVKVEATKQVFLESCPPVLILHLKRFLYNHVGGVQKSSKRVGFGTELDIRHELLAPNKRGKPVRYSLYGVVYHHGTSASGGHYTVAVRQPSEGARGWLEIDDTSVRPIGQGEVVVAPTGKKSDGTGYQDPYLLLYNRVD